LLVNGRSPSTFIKKYKMKKSIIIEVPLFAFIAASLITAAWFSDFFVPSSFEKETFKPSVIEPRDNRYGFAHAGEGLIWMAGNNGKIIRSKDGGKNWETLKTGTILHLQDIAAWDEDHLVAVGNDAVIMTSQDGGDNWIIRDSPKSEVANKLIRVKTFPNGVAWACGILGAAFYTDDYGHNWQRRIPEIDIAYNDIAFVTEEIGVIVCEFGKIMRTIDGGNTWEQIETKVDSSFSAVEFNKKGTGIAVGLDGIILKSADYGKTWTQIRGVDISKHLWDIIYHEGQWISVGSNGLIASSSDDGAQWQVRQLSKTEMLWHTEVTGFPSKLIIVGGTQGIYKTGEWSYLF
jgi:photosystem II stability/assembly factor-like uncharacterized protein